MVRITRVHTGGGDGGETSLLTGERVAKSIDRVELFGTIDELNSFIGLVRMELTRLPKEAIDGGVRFTTIRLESDLEPKLSILQQELFDVGAECAGNPETLPKEMVLIKMEHADRLVSEMDVWTENTPPLNSFILPAGSPVIVALHVARTVARRAERCAVRLTQIEGEDAIRPEILAYLNRLSDWLFVACRHTSFILGEDEVLWTPLSSRKSNS